ncbi:MAG: SPOR domain-containing protein [Gammaproteobacteria bacterium]|nr:SPOR domain-containing protein [Gammaproteobacteria bacterium]
MIGDRPRGQGRATKLTLALAAWGYLSLASAADYVQIGVYTDPANVRIERGNLERLGFPAVERLQQLPSGKQSILLLVGPFERIDQARYQLNRLRNKGVTGTLRRFPDEEVIAKPTSELAAPPAPVLGRPVPQQPAPPIAKPAPAEPAPAAVEVAQPAAPESAFTKRLTGFIALEGRAFTEDALDTQQQNGSATLVLQPEFYLGWNDNRSSITFVPFVRGGDKDDERNHADIRELTWLSAHDEWELRLGIGKVFWGVTESQHLVDVINQSDVVENPDQEDKLGQPMINLAFNKDWGRLDLFALPGFRERTFPGIEGRFRLPLIVDTQQDATYESRDKNHHLDFAMRWTKTFGDWDVGLSQFAGTNREPTFNVGLNASGNPVLIPHYNLMQQTGLSVQAIAGGWIWKLEAISRNVEHKRYSAATTGFEYTLVGITDSGLDLGLIAEYLMDNRHEQAPTPYQNDLFVGLRWNFNDVQGTEILMGGIVDLDHDSNSYSIEASRRFARAWKASLEVRGATVKTTTDPLYPFRNDDYVQLELARYF